VPADPSERPARRRANELDGKTWTRHSVSVWSDLRKSDEELRLKHPAMFPGALVTRVIECFTGAADRTVLDPFAGIGSTPLAAARAGKLGIGVELNPEYLRIAADRWEALRPAAPEGAEVRLIPGDSRRLPDLLPAGSVDLVVTSPPYWNILTRRRTADYKEVRNYGSDPTDLGTIGDYDAFRAALAEVFRGARAVLRPGAYCVVNVMDLRRQAEFFPLHMDLCRDLADVGLELDDLIIWDRRHEYNSLRPLGYPAVFRINKVHEYLLIFRRPPEGGRGAAAAEETPGGGA